MILLLLALLIRACAIEAGSANRSTLAGGDQSLKSKKGGEYMWSIRDVSAEDLAKLFHHYRAALAHDFDCPSREGAIFSWDHTPQQERKLMVAAARLALLELATAPAQSDTSRPPVFCQAGRGRMGLLSSR